MVIHDDLWVASDGQKGDTPKMRFTVTEGRATDVVLVAGVLNKLTAQGWELSSDLSSGGPYHFLMSRKADTPTDPPTANPG